jgi:diguanylate cyclase (GGDEF)-like protein
MRVVKASGKPGWFGVHLGHWMVVLGVVVALCVTAGAAAVIVSARARAITDSSEHLQGLSYMLAAETERLLESTGLVLGSVGDNIRSKGYRSSDEFVQAIKPDAARALLADRIQFIRHIDSVGVFSTNGRLLASSRPGPVGAVDISHREDFQALVTARDDNFVVTRPVRLPGGGDWSLFVMRRVVDADGGTLAIVSATLKLAYFEQFYARMTMPQDGAIAIAQRDGVLLARYPRVEAAIGQSIHGQSKIFGPETAGLGEVVIRQTSPIDGSKRIIAAKMLTDYPIIVSVSRMEEAVLRPWRRDAVGLAILSMILDAVILLAAMLGLRQIRASERLAAQARNLARYDVLTGLPNRLLFQEKLDATLGELEQQPNGFAVLLFDLNGFKDVNDTFGQGVGDELLRAVSARLGDCVGEDSFVARLGADEFAIIQSDVTCRYRTTALAKRVLDLACAPYDLDSGRISIAASIGAVFAPADGVGRNVLMKNADLALWHAKADGRRTVRVFEPAMADRFTARQTLERDLRGACERQELELHYQPVVSLRSDDIVGFEALLRWRHPERGLVSPAEFVPIAEETGLIGALGHWILQEACRQAATWPAPLKVSVNLSPIQFKIRDVGQDIADALASSGLAPERLELEITESVRVDEDSPTKATLKQIRDLGVTIALDDFGTGYSSLSYLRSFPFDRIKIDRSFVAGMHLGPDCAAIVDATLTLAHKLGISVTAEGVETLQQRDSLRQQGCSEIQGYLISRALPGAETEAFIAGMRSSLAEVA